MQIGVLGGQVHGLSISRKTFLMILSSSEWKVMTQILPPGFKRNVICCMDS
jgi:hypothetical protein